MDICGNSERYLSISYTSWTDKIYTHTHCIPRKIKKFSIWIWISGIYWVNAGSCRPGPTQHGIDAIYFPDMPTGGLDCWQVSWTLLPALLCLQCIITVYRSMIRQYIFMMYQQYIFMMFVNTNNTTVMNHRNNRTIKNDISLVEDSHTIMAYNNFLLTTSLSQVQRYHRQTSSDSDVFYPCTVIWSICDGVLSNLYQNKCLPIRRNNNIKAPS